MNLFRTRKNKHIQQDVVEMEQDVIKMKIDDIIILDSVDCNTISEDKKEEELFNVELSLKQISKENTGILKNKDELRMDQKPPTKESRKTSTKLRKIFGASRRTTSAVQNDVPLTKSIITVDEKEKHKETRQHTKNNEPNNIAITRVGSKMSHLSRLSSRSSSSKLSHLSQCRKDQGIKSRQKLEFPTARSHDSNLSNIVSDGRTKKKTEDILTFTFSFDSIEGICCTNYCQETSEEECNVLVSYFTESVDTGMIKRYDIKSLPIKKVHSSSVRKQFYHAKFEDMDHFGMNNSCTISVAMTRNKNLGYDKKDFYLQIGLKKGNEVVKLGNAILPLYGNESGLGKSIPLGNIKLITSFTGNKNRISHVSKLMREGLEPVSFPSDPRRKYALERSNLLISSLRVNVSQNEPNSMIICPSIDEKISNLSYEEREYKNVEKNKKKSKNAVTQPLDDNFQSSITDLLNLESLSTSESTLVFENHFDDEDDSAVQGSEACFDDEDNSSVQGSEASSSVFENNFNDEDDSTVQGSEAYNTAFENSFDDEDDSTVQGSEACSSVFMSDAESEHTSGMHQSDYGSRYINNDVESHLDIYSDSSDSEDTAETDSTY